VLPLLSARMRGGGDIRKFRRKVEDFLMYSFFGLEIFRLLVWYGCEGKLLLAVDRSGQEPRL
jgi:hypothetical protein